MQLTEEEPTYYISLQFIVHLYNIDLPFFQPKRGLKTTNGLIDRAMDMRLVPDREAHYHFEDG